MMTVTGTDFAVIVNGETYAPVDGVVSLMATAAGRIPFNFAIVNNGAEEAEFSVNFTYPAGSMENPAAAQLGKAFNIIRFR